MTIAAIIGLIVQFLPLILQATGVITPAMEALIVQLAAAIPGLIANLSQGKAPADDVLDVLQALQTELGALRAGTSLDTAILGQIQSLDAGITDALSAYREAETVCDPSTLTPLPTQL